MSAEKARDMRINLEMNVQAGLDPYFYLLEQPDTMGDMRSKTQREEERWSKVMRVIISHCTEYAQNVKKKMEEMDSNYNQVAKVKKGEWINGKWIRSTMNFKKYDKQQLVEFNKAYCDIGMVLKPIYPFITTTFDPEDTTLVTLFPSFSDHINTLRDALFSLYEILELRNELCHNTTGRLTKKQFSIDKGKLITSITNINAFLNTTEKAERIILDCMSEPYTAAEYSSTLLAAYYISSRILEECRS